LWLDLKEGNSDPRGLVKDVEHIEELCIKVLMSLDPVSDEYGALKNFMVIAEDVKSETLNVEVDYPYICETIEKVLSTLD